MNIKVVFHSSTGNTKVLAQAIADAVSCEAEELGKADIILPPVLDLLFIGDGIYYERPDLSTVMFIKSLDARTVKNVALFATCGDMMYIGETLKNQVEKRRLNVIGEPFVCKGEAWGYINKRRPNKKDIANAQNFARNIMEQCRP